MAKPIGPVCNLDCRYCFYLEKEHLYPDKRQAPASAWAMPEPVLEAYIRQLIAAQPAPVVTFTWQGGEPTLLGLAYFRRVLALQQRHARGKRIENCLQTHGMQLDDDWCAFLAGHRFLVGVSLDGPRHLHDRYRVDKGGRPTFDRVMDGVRLLKKHGVEFNTLTAVHAGNAEAPLEVYRFLREEGSGYMQFIPVVERHAGMPGIEGPRLVGPGWPGPAEVTPWSVTGSQYGGFLCAVFDAWVRQDVGRCYVQLFDAALEAWLGLPPSLCVFQETCGTALALEHNGDLYACDHFVDGPHRLGNILDRPLEQLAHSRPQRDFGAAKRDTLPAVCRACDVRFVCQGECPKHRFARTAAGEPGLNHLCAGYQSFFRHIDPCMRFMADEIRRDGAPAHVMEWVRRRDARPEPPVSRP